MTLRNLWCYFFHEQSSHTNFCQECGRPLPHPFHAPELLRKYPKVVSMTGIEREQQEERKEVAELDRMYSSEK